MQSKTDHYEMYNWTRRVQSQYLCVRRIGKWNKKWTRNYWKRWNWQGRHVKCFPALWKIFDFSFTDFTSSLVLHTVLHDCPGIENGKVWDWIHTIFQKCNYKAFVGLCCPDKQAHGIMHELAKSVQVGPNSSSDRERGVCILCSRGERDDSSG